MFLNLQFTTQHREIKKKIFSHDSLILQISIKKKTSFHKICYEQGQDEHEKTIKITKKFGTARQNEKKHLTYLRFVTGFVELPKCN